jgi:hypothetical protein
MKSPWQRPEKATSSKIKDFICLFKNHLFSKKVKKIKNQVKKSKFSVSQ